MQACLATKPGNTRHSPRHQNNGCMRPACCPVSSERWFLGHTLCTHKKQWFVDLAWPHRDEKTPLLNLVKEWMIETWHYIHSRKSKKLFSQPNFFFDYKTVAQYVPKAWHPLTCLLMCSSESGKVGGLGGQMRGWSASHLTALHPQLPDRLVWTWARSGHTICPCVAGCFGHQLESFGSSFSRRSPGERKGYPL